MSSGACALLAAVTLICNCTICPTTASELVRTAVTLGESADARCANKNAISVTPVIFRKIDILFKLRTSSFPLPVVVDTTRPPPFVELHARFLIFHRFQKCFRLSFAHLPFLFGL